MDLNLDNNKKFNESIFQSLSKLKEYKSIDSISLSDSNFILVRLNLNIKELILSPLIIIKGELNDKSTFDRKYLIRIKGLINQVIDGQSLNSIKYIWLWLIFDKKSFLAGTHGGARASEYQHNFSEKIEQIYRSLRKNFNIITFKISVFNINAFSKFYDDLIQFLEKNKDIQEIKEIPWDFDKRFQEPINFFDEW